MTMRFFTSLASTFAATALLLSSDRTTLPTASAAKSYGGRPSGGGSTTSTGSRPNSNSNSAPYSSPSSPSSSSNFNNRNPAVPTRPAFQSPSGPISPTSRSPYNPNPSYKPLSPTGAPSSTRSGGGGYGSIAKRVVVAAAVGTAAVIAVNVAAGYFLYGGRNSGPHCRGDDQDRFVSGRCPRGQSSQAHGCKTNIPLCPIPELVRGKWNLGGDGDANAPPPKVDVLFDKSVCSVVALPVVETAETTMTVTDVDVATNDTDIDNTTTTTTNETDATTESTSTVDGVEGQSGLDACLRRIIASGGCDAQNAANTFLYDDDTQSCGCCSSVQVTTLADENFASAVYSYRANDDLTEAPRHCISGSIMYYPDVAGGPDVAHPCECGSCTTCGAGAARYLDWSGPFVVPDAVGTTKFSDAAKTVPVYDPVDTCLCDDFASGQCEGDFAASMSGSSGVGVHSPSYLVLLSSGILLLLPFLGRN